ncbi:hypothetical protein H4Q26_007415 [Puccinia striiformis f. sp. tritici PST-130]|nr:hypothetical protein H4Q26_007415 [Puccinia striiformis f. sp. tritici PST-130]
MAHHPLLFNLSRTSNHHRLLLPPLRLSFSTITRRATTRLTGPPRISLLRTYTSQHEQIKPTEPSSTSKTISSVSVSDLRRLARLAKPETKTLSLAGGLLAISSSVSLSMPFLWGRVIDIFTNPELLQNFSSSLPQDYKSVRTSAFASIMRADISWHDLRPSSPSSSTNNTNLNNSNDAGGTGDLVSRLSSDCHIVGDSITRDLADGTKSLVTVIAGVSMMFLISSKLTLVIGFTGNATIIALLTYGGTLVSRGEISVGDLSSLMMYTAYVGSSLISLSSWFATLMKGLGASNRIFEILDAKPVSVILGKGRTLDSGESLRPVVFKNVHFSYPARPNTPILNGLDLEITPGSSLAIAGSSGSGKSTLAYLLLRFYDPQSGGIYYGDERIDDFTPESWRSNIGAVPQDPALLTGTVAENIRYGVTGIVPETMMIEAARLANALEFIDSLPARFETEVGPKGIQLSGGQRQRLAIARALVRQPKLLILDEATSALDTASENEVNLAIQSIMNSRSLTTVIIAHRLSTLKTADRIVYMEDGKIVESGTYDELSREGTGFNLMIRSQLLAGGGRI